MTATLDKEQSNLQYRIGGFAGAVAGAAPEIIGCYSTGNVTVTDTSASTNGNRCAALMIGAFLDASYGEDCHASGTLTAANSSKVGMMCGRIGSTVFAGCTYVASTAADALTAIGGTADPATITKATAVTIPYADGSTFIVAPAKADTPADTNPADTGSNNDATDNKDTASSDTSKTETDAPETSATTDAAEEKGCGGTIMGAGAILLVGACGLAFAKKKEND